MNSKKRRRSNKKLLDEKAVLIKCKYCMIVDTCGKKKRKIDNENKQIRTFCSLTPNKSQKTLGKLTKKKMRD